MSHKTIAKIAVAMVVVFGAVVMIYPLIFNPTATPAGQVEVQPVPTAPVTPVH